MKMHNIQARKLIHEGTCIIIEYTQRLNTNEQIHISQHMIKTVDSTKKDPCYTSIPLFICG